MWRSLRIPVDQKDSQPCPSWAGAPRSPTFPSLALPSCPQSYSREWTLVLAYGSARPGPPRGLPHPAHSGEVNWARTLYALSTPKVAGQVQTPLGTGESGGGGGPKPARPQFQPPGYEGSGLTVFGGHANLGTPEVRVVHARLVIGDGDERGGGATVFNELVQHLLVVHREAVHVL